MALNKKEKLEKLNEAVRILKTEFIGLDSIIDQIKENIMPWYLTPDLLTRPVIISLWGMTGTGKTSLVNRLIELLELNKVFKYNCGSIAKETRVDTFVDSLYNFVNNYNEDASDLNENLSKDLIFVLDEFQYSRTVGGMGADVERPSQQEIWSLLDNGIIDVNKESNYVLSKVSSFVSDLRNFIKRNPDAVNYKIDNFYFTEESEIVSILSYLGYFWWDRKLPYLEGLKSSTHTKLCDSIGEFVSSKKSRKDLENNSNEEEDFKKPLKIIPEDVMIRYLALPYIFCKKVNALDYIKESKNLGELTDRLSEIVDENTRTSSINCSNSLIFIIGNLDEAFTMSKDITPDMDADIFYELTSKITINDLKKSLLKRFRPEQVSRIGNNIIKYPVLKSEYFKKIISKEIDKISLSFKQIARTEVYIDESVVDLIYSEGVYPTQGTRPVFSTINSIFSPILSEIYSTLGNNDVGAKITIEVENPNEGYNLKTKTIRVLKNNEVMLEKEIALTLGSLRMPENCRTRYAKAVHEIGHAIVYTYCTGSFPADIMAVGSGEGGWCVTKDLKLCSKPEIEDSVRVSLGGIVAEQLIFGEKNILMGSGSDLDYAWNTFTEAVYDLGYLDPIKYVCRNQSNCQTPKGLSDSSDNILSDMIDLRQYMKSKMNDFIKDVETILKENKTLLKKAALDLGEIGRFDDKKFKEYVDKYGVNLDEEKLKKTREKYSFEFYKNFLLTD